nr:ribonuclease H-like domain-containing protein [Tanacetum cinerariifolium]
MLATKRAKEKRNKPPTQAQQRTYMSNYLKNMGGYKLKQLKQYSFKEIKISFENTMKSIRRFVLMESEGQAADFKAGKGSSKAEKESSKKARGRLKRNTSKAREDKDKRQKNQDDPEKLTLMEYVEEDMKIMFEPDGDDEVWKNHHSQELIKWRLYDSCGVNSLMQGKDQQREILNKANLEIIAYQLGLESLEYRIVVYQKNEAVFKEDIAFLKYDVKVRDKTSLGYDSPLNERDFSNKSDVFESACDSSVNESEDDNNQENDRYKADEGYHVVHPPYTGNFMPLRPDLSFAGLDDSVFKSAISETSTSKTSKESMEKPKIVRPSAPIIKDWESDNDDDCELRPSIEQNIPSHAKSNVVKSDENTRKSVIETQTYKQAENLRKSQNSRDDVIPQFKNRVMNEFCEEKGIKREYSVARTPQQNEVAERRNKTLIEAARTMLVDSKLPTIFWAEAVNTACYVKNRVLVIKPHFKTPYELFRGRPHDLSFMRPFECHVTILNTLYHLRKFDGKSD